MRLHDELDVLEERRGKVEEENRHLTDLLEQADRKQFRLEIEVDKLRDKVGFIVFYTSLTLYFYSPKVIVFEHLSLISNAYFKTIP